MKIEVDDMIVANAMIMFNCVKVAAQGLIGSGPENIDLNRDLGLAQALNQRLGDGAVSIVALKRPSGDD